MSNSSAKTARAANAPRSTAWPESARLSRPLYRRSPAGPDGGGGCSEPLPPPPLGVNMQLISLNDIEVRSRQRSNIPSGPLNELKDSILSVGLLNPPVAWYDAAASKWTLVAGERRLR